jgi:putative transposase
MHVLRLRPNPYLFVDAKVEKVRDGGRVVRKCVVIAHAVHESRRREIIGLDLGEAETEAFWREFLRSLVTRGLSLSGVQLAISDAHPGLKAALAQVLGCAWQRCTVHFLRDCLGHARKDQHGRLGALIRPACQAATGERARDRLDEAVAKLERPLRAPSRLLHELVDVCSPTLAPVLSGSSRVARSGVYSLPSGPSRAAMRNALSAVWGVNLSY